MSKRSKKGSKSQAKSHGYVVVTFADDYDQAQEYETLLKSNDIPVVIEEHYDDSLNANEIAVMVPDEYIDEAHVIIESQDVYDEFYDLADEDDEFSGDFYDEDY